MLILKKLFPDKDRESLQEKINSRLEFVSQEGVSEEEDLELRHMYADLEVLDRKQKKITKKELRSLNLSQLMGIFRELHPNETYDLGYGCRTLERRKRAYADVIYNYYRN